MGLSAPRKVFPTDLEQEWLEKQSNSAFCANLTFSLKTRFTNVINIKFTFFGAVRAGFMRKGVDFKVLVSECLKMWLLRRSL